jgi:hypothetical protein
MRETRSRSYKLDSLDKFPSEAGCLPFYYYSSNDNSNRSIQNIVEDSQFNHSTIILTVFSFSYNKWCHIRKFFSLQ